MVSCAVLCVFPTRLYAGTPTDTILRWIRCCNLNNAKLSTQAAKQERRGQSLQVIYPRFDFANMARRSLGPTWRRITPADQQEFVRLFTPLLEESYVSNIEGYKGEKILYGCEIQEQDFAEV